MTNGSSILDFFAWLFGAHQPTEPFRILATGKWRQYSSRRRLLELALNHPITHLSQEDEGILQAQSAFDIMLGQGYITTNDEKPYYLFIGAGRGSTQITILDIDGNEIDTFNVESGYPKDGNPNLELLNELADQVSHKYKDSVNLIVGFDSIYHVLKKDCHVIPNDDELPAQITTFGRDFVQLGYLTNHFLDTPMLVVRNFVTNDGNMRKISFATGDHLLIDLGSGNANLVDPKTGQQILTKELPIDWMTNDESLITVGEYLEELLHAANEYYGI